MLDRAATPPPLSQFQQREVELRACHVAMLDGFADERDRWREKNAYYYRSIEELVRFVVPAGARVLEVGCGTGDLLAALQPSVGVGIDASPRMIERARHKHSRAELTFVVDDGETLTAP